MKTVDMSENTCGAIINMGFIMELVHMPNTSEYSVIAVVFSSQSQPREVTLSVSKFFIGVHNELQIRGFISITANPDIQVRNVVRLLPPRQKSVGDKLGLRDIKKKISVGLMPKGSLVPEHPLKIRLFTIWMSRLLPHACMNSIHNSFSLGVES
ncbi:hypothetical protein LJE06_14860 [Bilophila wadsworthia]|uniref:hypothetical protein n=1 Tax=Bilophila wadsworthia TaxID=35833 RepID=UPI001D0A926B|nr:hypothetical protein [Bilophila wadsworthia]MCB8572373.1 hypothetical protein [Bilophila wadsworthia]